MNYLAVDHIDLDFNDKMLGNAVREFLIGDLNTVNPLSLISPIKTIVDGKEKYVRPENKIFTDFKPKIVGSGRKAFDLICNNNEIISYFGESCIKLASMYDYAETSRYIVLDWRSHALYPISAYMSNRAPDTISVNTKLTKDEMNWLSAIFKISGLTTVFVNNTTRKDESNYFFFVSNSDAVFDNCTYPWDEQFGFRHPLFVWSYNDARKELTRIKEFWENYNGTFPDAKFSKTYRRPIDIRMFRTLLNYFIYIDCDYHGHAINIWNKLAEDNHNIELYNPEKPDEINNILFRATAEKLNSSTFIQQMEKQIK